MPESVSFSTDNSADGYLVRPPGGSGPGIIVVQEWWGLNPQIKGVADDLAAEGFVTLAPDLFHGQLAEHDEMDKAAHLMQTLSLDTAVPDMAGAVDYLLSREDVTGEAVGVIGFCMGGMLALVLAARQGDKIAAAVPWYGAPLDSDPDWSGMTASVRGHFAENDDFFKADAVRALQAELKALGNDVDFVIHPDTGHAFGNEQNALGTYDAAAKAEAWADSVAFLKSKLAP